ncbi:MAG: YezD family protein [Lachnospiraceae bacterium]|nr:YezD family protein [Lachnospiraceae bacterium]
MQKGEQTKREGSRISEKDLKKIVEYIEEIQFGSVSVVIQNGKIIQIEKNEKIRLS